MIELLHPHIKRQDVMIKMEDIDRWILDHGTTYMSKYNGSHDTMLEIGSHVGCSSTYFATEKDFKRILAIEAHFGNFKYLVNNIFANKLENVITPMWSAVALNTGEFRYLFWSRGQGNHGQYGTFFKPDVHINSGFCQTISFEHVLSLFDTIDVLKIDIEGGEYELFMPREGLKEVLKKVKFLELETHAPNPSYFNDDDFAQFGYPHQDTANVILKSFLKDCGFDFEFRGDTEGGMQGYNRNFKGWKILKERVA